MISIFKPYYIDDFTYIRVLEIVKEFGINLNYIEFRNRFGVSIWNEYCILTHLGQAYPTIINAPQFFQKVVKPKWPKNFVESELDRILFQLWYESIDAIIQLSAEYVILEYGDKLSYTDFVKLQEVPAEAYFRYGNMQLNIQRTAPFLENTSAPTPTPTDWGRACLFPTPTDWGRACEFPTPTDWGERCSFPIHPVSQTPLFEIMNDSPIDWEFYFSPATPRIKQTRNQAIKQVPIKQVPSNPTLYDNKKYNWVI
jgi:hypothetical protein